jgi:CDGSH-type Zn-finger protein
MFVHTTIVYTLFVMKCIKPKCVCGNTQNPNGYCDGTHAR